jgi:hypothetical protein
MPAHPPARPEISPTAAATLTDSTFVLIMF